MIRWSLIVLIAISSIYIFWPFMIALLLGGIFSIVISPYYEQVLTRWKLKRSSGALLFLSLFFVFAVIPFWAFILRGAKLSLRYINEHFPNLSLSGQLESQHLLNSFEESLSHLSELFGIDPTTVKELISTALVKSGQFLLQVFQDFISQLPSFSIFSIVILMATYFALVETQNIKKFFFKYSGLSETQNTRFVRTLQSSSQSILLANLITGFVQALIVTLGALFTGIGDVWLVFFITFFASFIPVGAGPIAFILALIGFTSDQFVAGIVLVAVALFTGIVDNILRPLLMRGEGELHPFVAFLAVIGGVIGFGLPGLFIGPLIAALLIHCMPILIETNKNS